MSCVRSPGAAGLAGCLASCRCPLAALCLSGCEVTDEGATALAAAVAGSPASADAAEAAGAASMGRRSAQHSSSLQELRLADNQITAAGEQPAGEDCVQPATGTAAGSLLHPTLLLLWGPCC